MADNSDIQQELKFSILTPVYNVEKYLDACLQSVLNQSYRNYELILVDDGSTDSSGEICDRYAAQFPQIKVFHKANEGLLPTRRFALTKAEGDVYVILDSDDSLHPDALMTIKNTMQKYDCDCVVYGFHRVRDGQVLSTATEAQTQYVTDKRLVYRKCFAGNDYNALWRKAIKASVLPCGDFSAYYHVKMGEDLLQSLEILGNSKSVVFIPDVLYNYTVNPASMTQTVKYENFRVDYTVRQCVLDFLRSEKVYSEEDYIEYRSICLKFLIKQLTTIARFDTSFENKKALFEQISGDPYYTSFLNRGEYNKAIVGPNWVVYALFQEKRYKTIVAVESVLKKIANLRHR